MHILKEKKILHHVITKFCAYIYIYIEREREREREGDHKEELV